MNTNPTIRDCFFKTDAVPVLFVSAAEVSVRVYCLTWVIRCHGTLMAMSLRWLLAPPPNMLGTY